jgi:hypothetical protein
VRVVMLMFEVFMVLGADKWRCGGGDVNGELECSELLYCKICRFTVLLLSSKPKAKQPSRVEIGPQYVSSKQLCCGLYISVVDLLGKIYLDSYCMCYKASFQKFSKL